MSIPGISPRDLAVKLKSESSFVLLDVRELWEVSYARIDDPRLVILPISQLAHARESSLPNRWYPISTRKLWSCAITASAAQMSPGG